MRLLHHDGTTVVRLAGALDMVSADDVWSLVASNVSAEHGVVLDCAGVDFLDSAGISTLVRIRDKCVADGATFGLCGLQKQPRRAIELIGLAEHFGLDDNTTSTACSNGRSESAIEPPGPGPDSTDPHSTCR
jgi:anti-anti-sigma factor